MSRRGRGPYAPETTRVAHPRSPRWSVRTSTSQNKELTSSSSAPGSPLVAARAEDRGADFSCVRLRFGIGIEVGSAAPASGSSPWASAPPMISRGKKAGGSVHSCTRTVSAARGRGRGRAPCTRGAKSRQLGGGSPLAEKNAGAPRNRLGCGFPDVSRRGAGAMRARCRHARGIAGFGTSVVPTSSGSLGRHITRSGRSTTLSRVFDWFPSRALA